MTDIIRVCHGFVLLGIMWEVIFGSNIRGPMSLDWFLLLVLSLRQRKGMRGKLVDTRNSWVHFDAHAHQGVTPVTSGRRVSITLYVLKGWERLGPDLLEDLGELGFPLPEQTATTLNPAVATGELKPAEAQTLSNDDLTDLTYDEDADDALEEHLRSNTQDSDRTPLLRDAFSGRNFCGNGC